MTSPRTAPPLSVDADIDHVGKHTVDWRAVSADGHPIEGNFTFTHTPAGTDGHAPSASTEAATSATAAPSQTAEPSTEAAAQTSPENTGFLIPAGIIILARAGTVIVLLTRRNRPARS